MTTDTSASTATQDEAATAAPISVGSGEATNAALNDYDETRRREQQWRIPQLLTALLTPILGLIAVIFNLSGINTYANIAGVLAIVTGAAAALMAVEMWRLHKATTSEA